MIKTLVSYVGFEVSNDPAAWKLDYCVTFELLISDSKKYPNWSQRFVPNFFGKLGFYVRWTSML